MAIQLYQVDAFTSEVFKGNPAAVCITDHTLSDKFMQQLAMENNLSETAYIHKEEDGYGLRWFTPATEVRLCGHATLASAHILWTEGFVPTSESIKFHTLSGILIASQVEGKIQLDFPARQVESVQDHGLLLEALGTEAVYVGRNIDDYIVEVKDDQELVTLNPNMSLLAGLDVRGVIVTAIGDSNKPYDFVSRFFAPRVGVPEDPVTGSAHCCLGPYWQTRTGKDNFLAYQTSSRGGEIGVSVMGDRVLLSGTAVTVMTMTYLGEIV